MNSKRRSWQRWMNWRENFNIKDQSQLSILLSSGSTVQSIVMKQKPPPITLEQVPQGIPRKFPCAIHKA